MASDYYFISYSAADGAEHAFWLAEQLRKGSPSFEVWLDKERLLPGFQWNEQLAEGLRRAQGVLFIETPDSVNSHSFCAQEIARALSYRKHVVPLRFCEVGETLLQLETQQRLDFVADRDARVGELREHLTWLATPDGRLRHARDQLEYAMRDFRRATSDTERARALAAIDLLQSDIDQFEAMLNDPVEAARRSRESIEQRLVLTREPPRPPDALVVKRIHDPPTDDSRAFQNRYAEISLLIDAVSGESRRLVVLVGRGGIGKTSMVCRFLRVLEQGESWQKFGRVIVDGIVYLAANGLHPITAANILRDLCGFLPEPSAARMLGIIAQSGTPIGLKVAEVLAALSSGRYVLLLDNFETLVDSESGRIVDRELHEALAAFLRSAQHSVKVVVTTRAPLRELALIEPSRQLTHFLEAGLAEPFAENLLRSLDSDGVVGLRDAPAAQLAKARELTLGHPRALGAIYGILSGDRSRTLEEILQSSQQHLPQEVVAKLVGEAFSVLPEMSQRVMEALAILMRPVPSVAVDILLKDFYPGFTCEAHLRALVNMLLVRKSGELYHVHEIDAAYAIERLPPGSDPSPSGEVTRSALRRRAVEYYRGKRRPREEWQSVADVQEAELAEFEILVASQDYEGAFELVRRLEYHLMLWGEGGRLAYLNQQLESHLTQSASKMSCVGSRALGLELQGKYEEALPAYDSALTLSRRLGDRDAEVSFLNNRAICQARLGRASEAIEAHRQALELLGYDRRGWWDWVVGRRETWQTAVHLNGLGCRLNDCGDFSRALELNDAAIRVARERRDEAFGEYFLASALESQGQVLVALNRFDEAQAALQESLQLGRRIASVQTQSHAEFCLACIELYCGRWNEAAQQAMQAAERHFHETRHQSLFVASAAKLRAGASAEAEPMLDHAIHYCRRQLEFAAGNFVARYTLALALCAKGCCAPQSGDDFAAQSAAEFRAARGLNRDAGVVQRFARLLSCLENEANGDLVRGVRDALANG